MRISIALCTYNGARYLQDQLDSIASQERLPDELIVCDDVSSDETMSILHAFARTAPFRVEIEQNPHNLGSTQNFATAIGKCTGDMIALCDQDDYWHSEKLKLLESALEAQPEKGLVFSNADLVDDRLRPLKKTMWEDVGLKPASQARIQTDAALSMLLKRRYVTGATMAFRASFRDVVLPISSNWVHDGWITINIAAHSTFALVPRSLIQYRQHARNQIGTMYTRKHMITRVWYLVRAQPHTYQREYQAYMDLLSHLTQHLHSERAPELLRQVEDKVEHWQIRASIDRPRGQRIRQILGELRNGRYQRYSVHGVWSAMRDLLYFSG
jgi:glycosyltransferase involved in cell wall biosynthesis